jgi:hypothetical protein
MTEFMKTIYWGTKRLPFNIKTFFQRLFTGLAAVDAWECYFNMAPIIVKRLKHFIKAHRVGYQFCYIEDPIFQTFLQEKGYILTPKDTFEEDYLFYEDDNNCKIFQEAWEYILNEMLFGFEFTLLGMDDPECWKDNPQYDPKYAKTADLFVPRIEEDGTESKSLTLNEDPRFERKIFLRDVYDKKYERARKGRELFGKYFMNLWD